MNQRFLKEFIELISQAVNMHFDHVGRSFPIVFPEVLTKHFSRYNLAGVTHQQFHQAEFGRREVDILFTAAHAAILRARPRRAADDDDEAEDQESDLEVSFVLAARRKAFWRKPVVRMALGLVFFISLLGLALQIAVQERDRIAALDARTRPWLVKLCEPLRCELAPVRQIADVVIDSSSFNKARGDSYQLALTMKSTATIPLAMPAVELTLTDAQDQPVLRRVLLPTDMAAPAELPDPSVAFPRGLLRARAFCGTESKARQAAARPTLKEVLFAESRRAFDMKTPC